MYSDQTEYRLCRLCKSRRGFLLSARMLDKVGFISNDMDRSMDFNLKSLFGRDKSEERRTKERANLPDEATVLIVDDSRTAIAVLKKTLEPTGYSIISAGSAEEGIEMAKVHLPDIILMDVIMPGLNGFQATRILRKETLTQHIPIIIISGNEQATEKFWGLRIGANGFLAKPVERGELYHLLGEHLPRP